MFHKMIMKSSMLFGFIALLWAVHTCVIRASDIASYKSLVQSLQKKTPSQKQLSSSSHQTRQGVRKDIWFSQEDGSRLHTRIESQSSLLTLHPKGNRLEVVEELQKIHCWMQDRLYTVAGTGAPMQQMRYLEADTGTYLYSTQQFVAQSVTISLFRLPGHVLSLEQDPSSAFVRGIAQDVSFAVSGKSPQFQAKNFKASFSKL